MQLTPAVSSSESSAVPSKTWKIDFENKKITGTVDGLDALRQAVFLCLSSERYEHVIYSWNYGVEMKNLQGKGYELVRRELQTAIEEALTADGRITSVSDFSFTRGVDYLTVKFTVICGDGSVIIEGEYDV